MTAKGHFLAPLVTTMGFNKKFSTWQIGQCAVVLTAANMCATYVCIAEEVDCKLCGLQV